MGLSIVPTPYRESFLLAALWIAMLIVFVCIDEGNATTCIKCLVGIIKTATTGFFNDFDVDRASLPP